MRAGRIIVSSVVLVAAMAASVVVIAQGNDTTPLFKVTGEVITQHYCEVSKGAEFALSGEVRLRLTNESKESLIVSRYFLGGAYQFTIAHDSKELASGAYEYKPHYDWTVEVVSPVGPGGKPAPPPPPDVAEAELSAWEMTLPSGEKAPGRNFAILKAGEFIEGTLGFGVESISEEKDRTKFSPGTHVIRYEIGSWADPGTDGEKYRRRWRQSGLLIYEAFRTEPIPLEIPPLPADMKPCHGGSD